MGGELRQSRQSNEGSLSEFAMAVWARRERIDSGASPSCGSRAMSCASWFRQFIDPRGSFGRNNWVSRYCGKISYLASTSQLPTKRQAPRVYTLLLSLILWRPGCVRRTPLEISALDAVPRRTPRRQSRRVNCAEISHESTVGHRHPAFWRRSSLALALERKCAWLHCLYGGAEAGLLGDRVWGGEDASDPCLGFHR